MAENIEYSSSSSDSSDGVLYPISDEDSAFDYIDATSYSGIMKDVLFNDIEAVSQKIREGKSVRVVDNVGNTLLHLAISSCERGELSMINFLLDQEEIDIDTPNYIHRTPLLDSIKRKKRKVALHLIERGAKIEYPEAIPPLHEACRYGLPEVAKCIIEKGVDVNSLDRDNDTPLHVAVYYRQLEMVCLLLYYGAEMLENDGLLNPFDMSLQTKATQITDVLVDYALDEASLKINLGVNFHHKNLYYYVERVIHSRREDETSYLPNRDAWLRLQKKPDVLKLILNNFTLKRTFNTLIYELFHCSQIDWETIKRSLTVIMELNEDKLLAITEEYHQLFVSLIVVECRAKKPELESEDIDFIQQFCLVLLSYGLPAFNLDLDVVFELFGYGDFFKTLLHMDFYHTPTPCYNPLSYCIFLTDYRSTTQHKVRHIMCMQLSKGLLQCVDIPYMESFTMMAYREDYTHGGWTVDEGKLVPYRAVIPKLIDLARNKARDAICERFRITTSRTFYTLLNHACLPPKVKQLLCYEVPLYGLEAPSSEIREMNFQRMKSWILEERMTPFATLNR